MRLFSYRNRPVHLGPWPLERLTRASDRAPEGPPLPPMQPLAFDTPALAGTLAPAIGRFMTMFDLVRDGVVNAQRAEVPTDEAERARHLKAAGYYFDASMMGACRLDPADCATEPLLKDHKQLFAKRLAAYRANLEQLAAESRKLGATPVFVTQTCRWYKLQDGKLIGNRQTLKVDGHELNGLDVYYLLDALNDEARGMKDAVVIDVARDLDFGDDDFYDLAHNTPQGAEKLGKFLAGRLPK